MVTSKLQGTYGFNSYPGATRGKVKALTEGHDSELPFTQN